MSKSQSNSSFYTHALSEAERERLADARDLEGLGEEIALLRVRLYTAALTQPGKLEVLVKGINALVRLVSMQYKLSDKPAQEFSDHLLGVIREIGGAIDRERFSGI